jgi:hypothetical protein
LKRKNNHEEKNDAPEEQFVYDLLEGQEGYWLGGYQDRNSPQYAEPYGAWKWVTGEPWRWGLPVIWLLTW